MSVHGRFCHLGSKACMCCLWLRFWARTNLAVVGSLGAEQPKVVTGGWRGAHLQSVAVQHGLRPSCPHPASADLPHVEEVMFAHPFRAFLFPILFCPIAVGHRALCQDPCMSFGHCRDASKAFGDELKQPWAPFVFIGSHLCLGGL